MFEVHKETMPWIDRELVLPNSRHVSRKWLHEEVEDWRNGNDGPVFALTGSAGTGKSIFSAALARRLADQSGAGQWSASHFCSDRLEGGSTDPRTFIRSVSAQLGNTVEGFKDSRAELAGSRFHGTVNAQFVAGTASGTVIEQMVVGGTPIEEMYELMLEAPIRMLLMSDHPPAISIIVDGLDEVVEVENSISIVEIVRRLVQISVRLKLFVTTQSVGQIIERLRFASNGRMKHLDLDGPEWSAEVEDDVKSYIQIMDREAYIPDSDVVRVRDAASGNFLHAEGLIEDMLAGDNAVDVNLPSSLPARYSHLIDRVLNGATSADPDAEDRRALLLSILAVVSKPVPMPVLAAWIEIPEPQLESVLAKLEPAAIVRDGSASLQHRALGEYLKEPASRTSNEVDTEAANRLILDFYVGPSRVASNLHDGYALPHLVDHAIAAEEQIGPDITDKLVDAYLDPKSIAMVTSRRRDSLSAGRAHLLLGQWLISQGHFQSFERLATSLIETRSPNFRSGIADGLLAYSSVAPSDAQRFLLRLARSDEVLDRFTALRVLARLDVEQQVSAFAGLLAHAKEEVRLEASNALALSWAPGREDVALRVLTGLADRIRFHRPVLARRLLEFVASASVTNYILNCSSQKVAQLTSDFWFHVFIERLAVNRFANPYVDKWLIAPVAARHMGERVVRSGVQFSVGGPTDTTSLGQDEKEDVRAALKCLDPAEPIEGNWPSIMRCLGSKHLVWRVLAAQAIAVHAMDEDQTVEAARDRFRSADPGQQVSLVLAFLVLLPSAPRSWLGMLEMMSYHLLEAGLTLELSKSDPILRQMDVLFVPLGLALCRVGEPLEFHREALDSDREPEIKMLLAMSVAVVGLFYPAQALEALRPLAADPERQPLLGAPLGLIAGVYPELVDDWATDMNLSRSEFSDHDRAGASQASRYVDVVGLYSNGVHQAIHYPYMRREILSGLYESLLDHGSERDAIRDFTNRVLAALREAEYRLLNWTLFP